MVTYSPVWSPPLIVGRQQWGVGTSAAALSSSWQMSLFMNILCTARPWCCTCSFDLHFKRKFCLCHCQRLCGTQCVCAVTCLFERSNRRATQSSSGFAIQSISGWVGGLFKSGLRTYSAMMHICKHLSCLSSEWLIINTFRIIQSWVLKVWNFHVFTCQMHKNSTLASGSRNRRSSDSSHESQYYETQFKAVPISVSMNDVVTELQRIITWLCSSPQLCRVFRIVFYFL